jgi:hypothetical protein
VLYWSGYNNVHVRLGKLWVSYDIRNDPRLRKRKLRLRWQEKGDFLEVLRKELERIRDEA